MLKGRRQARKVVAGYPVLSWGAAEVHWCKRWGVVVVKSTFLHSYLKLYVIVIALLHFVTLAMT